MSEITRFSVEPLWKSTQRLAAVASGRAEPDLVIGSARARPIRSASCPNASCGSAAAASPR